MSDDWVGAVDVELWAERGPVCFCPVDEWELLGGDLPQVLQPATHIQKKKKYTDFCLVIFHAQFAQMFRNWKTCILRGEYSNLLREHLSK